MKCLNKKSSASALLLSFFMMSLLIGVSVGVSFLLIKDVGTVRTVVAGVQTRYAAEGMSELGLQVLKNNLPGYEPEVDYAFSNNVLASLDLVARDSSVPCGLAEDEDEWAVITPNESVQLALCAQLNDDASEIDKINNYYVEFYVGDEEGVAKPVSADALRWKILGQRSGVTEAISEFIPMESAKRTPENPSIFGSAIPTERAVPPGYAHAKYSQRIGGRSVFHAAYPIGQFLDGHDFNYLILTNAVQASGENYIYFKLHSLDVPAVCQFVNINTQADMDFGSSRKTLETLAREGENLPVFDFVLYHTKND